MVWRFSYSVMAKTDLDNLKVLFVFLTLFLSKTDTLGGDRPILHLKASVFDDFGNQKLGMRLKKSNFLTNSTIIFCTLTL